MGKNICEVCGCRNEFWSNHQHYIAPKTLTQKAGMLESTSVNLCNNCLTEINAWYSKKVFKMVYDLKAKKFRHRSPVEMVKEYEDAYGSFAEYKKQRRNTHKIR